MNLRIKSRRALLIWLAACALAPISAEGFWGWHSAPAAWACALPAPQAVSGVVRGVAQERGVDPAFPWGPDLPGAILELQGPAGLVRFRLSRNIGMTLEELRARAATRRPVRVKYETTYEGQLRALQIVGTEQGR
jgi:hypothetical protein